MLLKVQFATYYNSTYLLKSQYLSSALVITLINAFWYTHIMNEQFPQPENSIETSYIKEGVESVFEQNPELATIGTKEQYSEYLDTIFPDTKLKQIVYHGTRNEAGKEINFSWNDLQIFFTPNYSYANEYTGSKDEKIRKEQTLAALLNIQKPAKIDGHRVVLVSHQPNLEGYDSTYGVEKEDLVRFGENEFKTRGESIGVFLPEQIHILGSKKDQEKFKEFVG